MLGFAKILVYFYLYLSVNGSYDYLKNSDRTSSSKTLPYEHYYKQSRYSKFDKVMDRIERLNADSDSNSKRLRHKGWSNYRHTTTTTTTTEIPLFETYGDLENEDDLYDYEDVMEDEDDYDDDESETEDPFYDFINQEIQAEEPPERTTTTAIPPKPISSLTEYKWSHFGTRERVEESRRQQINVRPSPEQLKINAVLEHYVRVNQQSRCLNPLPRVIPVQNEHPDPTKIYTPECTILHRCAEDSGCCNRNTKCQYKTRELVPLYLYAKTVGSSQNKIVRLEFYNHTKCECKEKRENVPSTPDDTTANGDLYKSAEIPKKNHPPANFRRCKCPKPFQSSSSSRKCICDCEKDDVDCVQLKKGKEHLSMINRICIQDGECAYPQCEYGTYTMILGKCPSKMDKVEEYRRMNLNT